MRFQPQRGLLNTIWLMAGATTPWRDISRPRVLEITFILILTGQPPTLSLKVQPIYIRNGLPIHRIFILMATSASAQLLHTLYYLFQIPLQPLLIRLSLRLLQL